MVFFMCIICKDIIWEDGERPAYPGLSISERYSVVPFPEDKSFNSIRDWSSSLRFPLVLLLWSQMVNLSADLLPMKCSRFLN